MSLHKLATVIITIEGLPEYTGTDDELQELTEEAEVLLALLASRETISKIISPTIDDKIQFIVTGLDQ